MDVTISAFHQAPPEGRKRFGVTRWNDRSWDTPTLERSMIQRDGTSMPQGQRRRAFSDFFMKLLVILLISLAVAPAVFAGPASADTAVSGSGDQAAAASSKQDLPILPNTFAGWEISGGVRKGIDAGTIDHAQSAALREYGFTGYEIATYSQASRMPREPTALSLSIACPARFLNELGIWLLPTMSACFFSGAWSWWKPASTASLP
jgi:hypothetical protein